MDTAPTRTDAATAITTDRDAALLSAYTAHLKEHGRRPSIRALRERARVSTDAAATWLKTHAPGRRPPEIPAENLTPVLAPLWAAAVDAAVQILQVEHQTALSAHVESERQALADAERATAQVEQLADRATAAESRAEALAREIATAQQEAQRAHAQAHEAGQAAAETRESAQAAIHDAEQAAAVARAEAATLREALATVRPATGTTQEK